MYSLLALCLYLFFFCVHEVNALFIDPMRHDITIVTPTTLDFILNRQRGAAAVSILLHYSEKNNDHLKYINDVYNEAARKMKGVIKFMAMDCAEWKVFCTSKNISPGESLVSVYPANPVIPIENLKNDPGKDDLINTSLKYVPGDHVERLTVDTFDQFIALNPSIPKVILYSSKEHVPVIFKALSNAFMDRINFGYIPSSITELDKKYAVKKRPSTFLIRVNQKKPLEFNKEYIYKELHDWINVYAETFVKGGGFVEQGSVAEAPKKPWLLQKLPEITGQSFSDICVKSNAICILYVTSTSITKDEMTSIYSMMESTESDSRFRWAWMNLDIEKNYAELFKVTNDQLPTLVALNTHKRPRYFILEKKVNKESAQLFIEKLVSGDGRFTIIKGQKMPLFSVRDNKEESKQEL